MRLFFLLLCLFLYNSEIFGKPVESSLPPEVFISLGTGQFSLLKEKEIKNRTDSAFVYGLEWGRYFKSNLALSVHYQRNQFSGTQMRQDLYSLSTHYRFWSRRNRWEHLFIARAGVNVLSDHVLGSGPKNTDYKTESFWIGSRQNYRLNDYSSFGLSTGIQFSAGKLRRAEQVQGLDVLLTYTYTFGDSRKKTDQDGDGIKDYLDQCQDTPFDMQVDARGCSLAQRDTDQDGVSDIDDECRDTPAFEPSNELGCSHSQKDLDRDGVVDRIDFCPLSPQGARVNSAGCGPTEKVEFTVYLPFVSGSDELKGDTEEQIKPVVDFWKQFPDYSLEVIGHSDGRGQREFNIKLSTLRAKAFKKQLVEANQHWSERIQIKGVGPDFPISDNTSASGRQKNRRIQAVFYYSNQDDNEN
jgi:outer membrane protein OmpA-like peptidoglycan-associated protein